MIVAIAGGHNILLAGPPGQGKTMLAKAAVELLPEMNREELLDVNKIYSAKGELSGNELVKERPYQEVSHTVNPTALYGGGREQHLVPGIVSLAHNGILFFDEINLCSAELIENLRVPLSDRTIRVQRCFKNIEFPCRFILVAAMNPCKCGWQGHHVCPNCRSVVFGDGICSSHPTARLVSKCTCTSSMVLNYKKKLSQPILDRIDLKVMVSSYDDMPGKSLTQASSTIRKKIQDVRDKQEKRFSGERYIQCNADIPNMSHFEEFGTSTVEIRRFARSISSRFDMTKRQEVKLFLVAQTIADLENSMAIGLDHISKAADFMGFGNDYFRGF
jgi:magnesium chelatase family protein